MKTSRILVNLLLDNSETPKEFMQRNRDVLRPPVREFQGFKVLKSPKTVASTPMDLLAAVSYFDETDPDKAVDMLHHLLKKDMSVTDLYLDYSEDEESRTSGLDIGASLDLGDGVTTGGVAYLQFPMTVGQFLKTVRDAESDVMGTPPQH